MKNELLNPIFTPASNRTWPPLLTIKQASQILGLSPWTLRKWDNEGKLAPVRIGSGKHRRYRKEDIQSVIEKGVE